VKWKPRFRALQTVRLNSIIADLQLLPTQIAFVEGFNLELDFLGWATIHPHITLRASQLSHIAKDSH